MDPFRTRVAAVVAVLVGSPICAEYLQAYLPSTGDVPVMLGSLLILGPLYGGAALLIREVAVRRQLGWTGILLLAVGFGLLMPGVVDLAMFGEHRDDIEYWDDLRNGTFIAPLGISAYGTLTWSVSHMLLSIGAPLALLDTLAPRHRGRPLLGRRGIVVLAALWFVAALFIHQDGTRIYDFKPTAAQMLPVVFVVAALAALALSPLGRPLAAARPGPARRSRLVVAGAVGIMALDFVPWTWAGVGVLTLILVGAGVALRRRSTTQGLGVRAIGALAAGALVGRTLTAFLAPTPNDVALVTKLAQNSVLLAATLGIAWLVLRQAKTPDHSLRRETSPSDEPDAPWRAVGDRR